MLNPHVTRIHVPAHVAGLVGIAYLVTKPSWLGLVSFLFFNLWFSGLGMSVGFHRYFTHKAFVTNWWWRQVMLWGGTLAGQGSVIFWAALHRVHHRASDTDEDVHSPRHGFWHAYMGWIWKLDVSTVPLSHSVDLARDPICRITHRHYTMIIWSWWLMLCGLAAMFPTMIPVTAGAFIAGMWSIHQEALVNSICHDTRFGRCNREAYSGRLVTDKSRDVAWLRFLTWGQSLHSTHHAWPARANFGWLVSDPGFFLVRLIRKL